MHWILLGQVLIASKTQERAILTEMRGQGEAQGIKHKSSMFEALSLVPALSDSQRNSICDCGGPGTSQEWFSPSQAFGGGGALYKNKSK